jgi:DNA end-binding protein Ku
VKVDEEMVKLAIELVKRQTSPYQSADIEDRYERRMREMIQAKLKGEGITEEVAEPAQSNVIDLMAALKRSLGPSAEAPAAAARASKKPTSSGKSAQATKPAPPSRRSKAIAPAEPAAAGKAPASKRPRKRA